MAYLHTILLLVGLLVPLEKEPAASRILWNPGELLTWDHFKGVPEEGSAYAALTKIDMSIAQGMNTRADAIELIFSTELITDGSWVKPDKKTAVILAHEQGHFDIAEYHARRLRKELLGAAPMKASRLSEEVDRIFDRIFQEKQQMQRDYDRETDHSMKLGPQLEWEARIALLLDSLSGHADRSVMITLR
jgi:hypothetical protein